MPMLGVHKTLLALPPVAGTLTRGLARFARILAHVLAPQSLALGVRDENDTTVIFYHCIGWVHISR